MPSSPPVRNLSQVPTSRSLPCHPGTVASFICWPLATCARAAHGGYPACGTARPTSSTPWSPPRAAEAAKFDAVFFADGLNFGPKATWAHKSTEDFEPLTATSYLAAVTERLGLVVTGSSTFQPPYHLARQLLSLDHLSSGRAGWNLVTSFAQAAAANFGERGFLPHDERYRLAEETLQVVKSLWHSLEPDTVIEDRAAGIYSDINKIHVANHDGEFHKVKGPLRVTPSARGIQ